MFGLLNPTETLDLFIDLFVITCYVLHYSSVYLNSKHKNSPTFWLCYSFCILTNMSIVMRSACGGRDALGRML